MPLHTLVRGTYGRRRRLNIKYYNLDSFKEVILLCQSLFKTRRLSNWCSIAQFTVPLTLMCPTKTRKSDPIKNLCFIKPFNLSSTHYVERMWDSKSYKCWTEIPDSILHFKKRTDLSWCSTVSRRCYYPQEKKASTVVGGFSL